MVCPDMVCDREGVAICWFVSFVDRLFRDFFKKMLKVFCCFYSNFYIMKTVLIASISLFFLCGCQKDEPIYKESVVPVQVQTEFDSFKAEAKKRGVKVNNFVEIVLVDNSFATSGLCDYANKRITIDTTSENYRYCKEQLLFHEFGHYFLNRGHLDGTLPNGDISSFMHSFGLVNCSGEYSYKRQYYIDELFSLK